jgi:hypothetical protein
MGQAVPTQHPAAGAPVVIPSNHKLLRALLAFAVIAIVGLTVAVVILATDGDEVTTSQAPASSAAEAVGPRQIHAPGQRYDGGPEEGTRGIVRSDPAPKIEVNPSTGYPTTRIDPSEAARVAPPPSSIGVDGSAYSQLRAAGALPSTERYDGGPEEGTRGPVKDYSQNSATGDYSSSPTSESTRYDGGPEEGTRGPSQ